MQFHGYTHTFSHWYHSIIHLNIFTEIYTRMKMILTIYMRSLFSYSSIPFSLIKNGMFSQYTNIQMRQKLFKKICNVIVMDFLASDVTMYIQNGYSNGYLYPNTSTYITFIYGLWSLHTENCNNRRIFNRILTS